MIISSQEIHLWYAYDEQICDSQLLSQYFNLLNPEEYSQQKRFYFEKHRHQYLITRTMLRTVLSFYAKEIAPEDWQFTKNDYGKPSIRNSSVTLPIRFNISHTEGLVVLAITLDHEVGVDVEHLLRSGKTVEIADNYFSPIEVNYLRELPPEKQRDRFFDFWTLKEAYIKACGMGLSIPLNQFSFSFSVQGEIAVSFDPARDDQPENWKFWQIRPDDNYIVSLAIKEIECPKPYSLLMRKIIPSSTIEEVDYPLIRKSSSAKMSQLN